jgi:magnesium chelatase subunit D
MRPHFPFSAIIGQDDLKLALLLVAIDPGIGGVLISGERGTAKSTAARALATLLPPHPEGRAAPFVELPLGATEDRVVGSLDVAQALKSGRAELRSGLLAKAHGGVLYVDEVNLLADHLVDLLLDAAASGAVTVEREGLSATEEAGFVLVGTMNPEEGELRPQFLDRFGFFVEIHGLPAVQDRVAAVRQRLAFDVAPVQFLNDCAAAEESLRRSISTARANLPTVQYTDSDLALIAELANQHQADGIRGDLATIKGARALAALQGREKVSEDDIRRVIAFSMPHRLSKRRRRAAARPGTGAPSQANAQQQEGGNGVVKTRSTVAATAPVTVSIQTDAVDDKVSGKRPTADVGAKRVVGTRAFDGTGSLAVGASVSAAALRGARADEKGVALELGDLRQHQREGQGASRILFVVDTSGSMGVEQRLSLANAVLAGLLQSSYQKRDEVALMTFRGQGAELVLPFTRHIDQAEAALRDVPTGGRTPLAAALRDAARLLAGHGRSLLVLFTDGRANVALEQGEPWHEALACCAPLREACAGALVIDCETGPISLGRAQQLAQALAADCIRLGAASAGDLVLHVQARMAAR